MIRRPGLFAALATLALLAAPPAAALTKLEGDYQLILDVRKSQRIFPWDWLSNSGDDTSPASLRLFSQPRAGTEAFVKFEAKWDPANNSSPRPEFQFREAHARFARDVGARGWETFVFARQDRFPTEDQYLIHFVNGYGTGQGVRLNTHGFLGVTSSWMVADFSDQYDPSGFPSSISAESLAVLARPRLLRTDDAYVGRLRREFFADHRLRLGMTWARREYNQGDSLLHARYHTQVLGGATRYRFRGVDFSLEYGQSGGTTPLVQHEGQLGRSLSVFRRPTGIALSDRGVWQAEARTLRLGRPAVGYLNFIPTWWRRGALWQNGLGAPNADETGFNFNTYYLLPARAITYTSNVLHYQSRAITQRRDREYYNELYIEFVNGFTGKTYLRQHATWQPQAGVVTREEHDDWFGELQVESRLAWLRVESKIRDIGRLERKQLFAVEHSVNLLPTLKVYDRFTFGNDASILRKGIFSQLQYRPSSNVEMYLQYGPDYIGGGTVPVDEGNLQGGADQADIVKFILRGTF